jgi:hypothetical protein
MKKQVSSIAVLVLSFLAGPRTFGAVADPTDADAPAPDVWKYIPATETSETLTELLSVNPQLPRGPNDILEGYEGEMAKIANRMSNELGEIRQAMANDRLSREQGESLARERYQVAMMQYELFSAWHAILEQDVTRVSAAQTKHDPSPTEQALVVALPFSSLQLNSSLEQYLELTPQQSSAIRQVMASERPYVVPLMAEFNATRQKLQLASRSTYPDQKQIRSLALTQARLLTKLVAEDTDLQRKVSQLLNTEQQSKVEKLKEANEVGDLRGE